MAPESASDSESNQSSDHLWMQASRLSRCRNRRPQD